MLKIIWNKKDVEHIKHKIQDQFHITITENPNEIPKDKVGLMIDESDYDKIKPILDLIAYENSQIFLQTANGYLQIYVNEITYLESFGDEIFLHTEAADSQVIKQPLYQLEEILKPYHFVRIGKSFIVNISKIRYIRTSLNSKLDLELTNGIHLEVTRSFVKDFKNALGIRKKED